MMKAKVLFLLAIISFTANAQRGVRLGYIDTEYILQNVPEYQEANTLLEKKVVQWKTEIEKRLSEIELKKTELENEKVLLTKELYDERFEDITFEESKIIDYQQNRFGPNGDLMIQKRQLIAPIQDQIFAAVQEIAELKKFDFIFDKSADVVMLYSAERYDISEQVLRTITRTSKREQAKNKKERKALEEEDVVPEVDKAKDARQKALDDKRAATEKLLEDRKKLRAEQAEARKKQQDSVRAAKIKANEERRQKIKDAQNKTLEENSTETDTTETKSEENPKAKTAKQLLEEKKQQKLKERDARAKALQEKKQKALEATKKAREEREAQLKRRDSISKAKNTENN